MEEEETECNGGSGEGESERKEEGEGLASESTNISKMRQKREMSLFDHHSFSSSYSGSLRELSCLRAGGMNEERNKDLTRDS